MRIPVPQQLVPNIANSRAAVPFYVEDDTGRVLVDAGASESSLSSDAKSSRHRGSHGWQAEVEGFLEPGDDVYVLGEAVPAEAYEEQVAQRGFGGLLGTIASLVMGNSALPASTAIDGDDDLVVTRTAEDDVFVVSDTSEWRSWIRQGLMAGIYGLVGLGMVAGGIVLFYLGVL